MRSSRSANSRARRRPSSSLTISSGARGEVQWSSRNCMAGAFRSLKFGCGGGGGVCVGRPEVQHGVGAPGAPALSAGLQLRGAWAAADGGAFDGAVKADVGGEEGVALAEGAHGDVLGGPFTDAGELAE